MLGFYIDAEINLYFVFEILHSKIEYVSNFIVST